MTSALRKMHARIKISNPAAGFGGCPTSASELARILLLGGAVYLYSVVLLAILKKCTHCLCASVINAEPLSCSCILLNWSMSTAIKRFIAKNAQRKIKTKYMSPHAGWLFFLGCWSTPLASIEAYMMTFQPDRVETWNSVRKASHILS